MENQNQKVYINPNFKRGPYLNRHFSPASNPLQQNARRIFVNPNFFPTVNRYQELQEKCLSHTTTKGYGPHYTQNSLCPNRKHNIQSSTCNTISSQRNSDQQVFYEHENMNSQNMHSGVTSCNEGSRTKSRYNLIRNTPLLSNKQGHTLDISQEAQKLYSVSCNIIQQTSVPQTKSRYCLIRNNRQNIINTTCVNAKKNTIKISKYKTIKISSLQNELKILKPSTANYSYQSVKPKTVQKNISLSSPMSKTQKQSKYKYKNFENIQKIKAVTKEVKPNSSTKRKYLNRSSTNGVPEVRKFKINNIPCPLYTKYGKCIRQLKRRCDYLHDKKHVSLCRKFIKGLCHDTNCLLSHELSDKKMPTCYFYLKGMCTKEKCPYVHVKLSNQTKLCKDFLKGYCDKGENCLERHFTTSHIYKKKAYKVKQLKTPSKKILQLRRNIKSSNVPVKEEINTQQSESDKRYYKDSVNENEECETIKPVRCKLGTLPSFIQLQ